MSGGIPGLSSIANNASYYVECAVGFAFSTTSSLYNKGISVTEEYSKSYPILRNFLPQENETSSAAIARGVKVGFGVVLTAAAAIFAANLLVSAASALTQKIVVGCIIGGLAGLAQNFHARLSAHGPAGAALSEAQQGNGNNLSSRMAAHNAPAAQEDDVSAPPADSPNSNSEASDFEQI